MDDLTFLEQAATTDPSATSILIVLLPDGSVTQIHGINKFLLLDTCPLLFHAFEFRECNDAEQANIEATSRSAAISLLRFLYTGTYLLDPEECSNSLLPHAEAFKIAEDFDVPEFQVQAYVNLTRETEYSCCLPTPPSDLCETIRFVYRHFAGNASQEHRSFIDTILNYCVSVFTYQVLGDRQDFRQTAFEDPAFHQDLCRTSLNRHFQDDGADEIVQLPVCRPMPHSQAALLKRAIGDYQYEIWQQGEEDAVEGNSSEGGSPKKKRRQSYGGFTLVYRPKSRDGPATCSESESEPETSSDEYGFSLVHRPKLEEDSKLASDSSQPANDHARPFTDLITSNPFEDPVPSGALKSEHDQQIYRETTNDYTSFFPDLITPNPFADPSPYGAIKSEPEQNMKQDATATLFEDEWDFV